MEQARPKMQTFEIAPIHVGHNASLLLHLGEVYHALEVDDQKKQLKLLFFLHRISFLRDVKVVTGSESTCRCFC